MLVASEGNYEIDRFLLFDRIADLLPDLFLGCISQFSAESLPIDLADDKINTVAIDLLLICLRKGIGTKALYCIIDICLYFFFVHNEPKVRCDTIRSLAAGLGFEPR